MSYWSFGTSWGIILLGLAVVITAAGVAWVHWRRRPKAVVAFMEGLRLLVIAMLAFTLLKPEFVRVIEFQDEPEVVVLVDESGSMTTRDLALPDEVITRASWLSNTLATNFWKPLEATGQVTVESFANTSTNAAAGTDLGQALSEVLQRQRNLKSVLLLTDGDWNVGSSPLGAATRYRDRGVPVYSVSVGREEPLPDLELQLGSVPSYGLVGEQVSIPFRVNSHLPDTVEAEITLTEDDNVQSRKQLIIPAQTEITDAIVWSPRTVGEFTVTLKLPVQPGEALNDNNEQTARIAVRSETLKVLVVESLPRWEYRFLRNALARDPGVEMHCVLFHPGMGPGGGQHYLPAFPGTKEMLANYDVVFLGDVGIGEGELKESDVELLKGLVEQQASGLVFLPGSRGRHLTLMNSPLADLMPVVLDKERTEGVGLRNESALLLTSQGEGHLLTRFHTEEKRNAAIWKGLPGFYWSASVEKSRPGSEVLAVHSSLRNNWGRIPLLVTRTAGNGKVLFMGTDSAWRWRRGVEDKYHYRFWSQVVRWMAHQRHLSEREGIRLTFSPESPSAGETVYLQATVLTPGGFPIEEGPVFGKVTSSSGAEERLEFDMVDGGWGVFTSRLAPEEGGEYTIALDAPKANRKLETKLNVIQPTREKIGRPANTGVLGEIAKLTLARTGPIEDLSAIVSEISALPEPRPLEQRVRLWANAWWGGAIVFLLAIYWIARKWAGMI